MKKTVSSLLAFLLILTAFSGLAANAAHPDGYWPYFLEYTAAEESGDIDRILRTGDAMLEFYKNYPINEDIAGMSLRIYRYRYDKAIFEKRGDYAAAIANIDKVLYFANYLNSKDLVIAATARKNKLDPMPQVYTYSNNSTVYYGAKHEPATGSYYGRAMHVVDGESNLEQIRGESSYTVYVEVGQNSTPMYNGIMREVAEGHLIQVALNFPNEAQTCIEVAAGTHDANIAETLNHIAKFDTPVLLRVGAEMNLWERTPANFIAAYTHIAKLTRSLAPNAALVWAPNYVGSWGANLIDYYPGDEYVDWIGLALYMNSKNEGNHTDYSDDSAFFGRGAFAHTILSAKEVSTFALTRKKPVIVTEGGTGIVNLQTGEDFTNKAVVQTANMFSILNMVYPQIKVIMYFDTKIGSSGYDYRLSQHSRVKSAHNAAVEGNLSLIPAVGTAAPSFVKLHEFSGTAPEDIVLSAYCHTLYGNGMNITYTLAGKQLSAQTSGAYACVIDNKNLWPGQYELKIDFNDNAGYKTTKVYTLNKYLDGKVAFLEGWQPNSADLPSSWAAEEVGLAMAQNLVPAAAQNGFVKNINRQDFCSLIIRLIEEKSGKTIDVFLADNGKTIDDGAFTDTGDKNILAANALGIVNGRGNNLFDCTAGITRQEAAKMLSQAALVLGISSGGNGPQFADNGSFASWAAQDIAFISATSDKTSGKVVMGGVGESLFQPEGSYTRQQAFITMLRLFRA